MEIGGNKFLMNLMSDRSFAWQNHLVQLLTLLDLVLHVINYSCKVRLVLLVECTSYWGRHCWDSTRLAYWGSNYDGEGRWLGVLYDAQNWSRLRNFFMIYQQLDCVLLWVMSIMSERDNGYIILVESYWVNPYKSIASWLRVRFPIGKKNHDHLGLVDSIYLESIWMLL